MYQPLDFAHERNIDIDELSRRLAGYYPDADFNLFKRAFVFAEKAHQGQKRSSGENYIVHPVNVASTLIKLKMDLDSIVAGLLHDVVEDCDVTKDEIEENFGKNIAEIVIGLTKISKIKFKTKEESQAENFRKMVVAMAKDIRIIIVKLADRMHNMRTLQYVSEEKQKKIAKETLDIYVPLASRLGINSVKGELEDLCLRFSHPDIYYRLAEKIAMKKNDRDHYIHKSIEIIKEKLMEYSIKAEVKGRPKHFYSIYKKMKSRDVDFDQIQDVLAFRIVVSNITECYKTLGIMHSSFKPLPGRFKDYIAIQKINGYQSLHSTLIGPSAERIEIQIRTHDMDEVAETGVAAHWKYKEGVAENKKNLAWVEQLIEFNQNVSNNNEFMDVVKNDLDYGGVFIFTPNGDVRELKFGATPLDFAYAVHTEVGNTCIGAKVNGRMVSLRHTLRSGDTVEILTRKNQKPTKDWLNIVKSSRAKTKIKQYILKIERDKNKEVGREIFEKTARLFGTSLKSLSKRGEIDEITKKLSLSGVDELYIQLGIGKIIPKDTLLKAPSLSDKNIKQETQNELEEIDSFATNLKKVIRKKSQKDNAVIVDGLDDVMVRIARCCNPIPGDPIVGYITRGRGITIHGASCKRIDYGELSRAVQVEWNTEFSFKHSVSIRAITHDRPGILSSISKNINALGINIKSAMAKSLQDRKGSFIFEIEVKDYSELLKVISNVESLEEVISVNRV